MCSFVKKFNKVLDNDEIRSVTSLAVGEKYRILSLRSLNTKYGRRIVAQLPNCKVFLPGRYGEAITDVDVEEFNKDTTTEVYLVVKSIRNSIAELEII